MTCPKTEVVILTRKEAGNPINYFDAKTFREYEAGFASRGELWLGLKKIHQLTTDGDYSLHVTLKDFNNRTYRAVYDHFEVGPGDRYEITVEWFNSALSTIGDSLTALNGMKFSAKDKDQDTYYPGNNNYRYHCAQKKKGGGWFSRCGNVHLTGVLTSSSRRLPDDMQIHWYQTSMRYTWYASWNSLREVEMKLVGERWARNRVDCQVGPWGSWTSCSATCGEGFKRRTRAKISDAKNNGTQCVSSRNSIHLTERITCNNEDCPEGVVILVRKEAGNPINYFDKTFKEYEDGFASKGEMWLGLKNPPTYN